MVKFPPSLVPLLRPLDSVRLDPANVNEHDDGQVDELVASILEFGMDQPVLVRPDGQLIAGEGRYLALRKIGATQIPAVETDLSNVDATRRAIGDNVIARKSHLNESKLAPLLNALRNEDERLLKGTGYDPVALDDLLHKMTPPDLDDLADEVGEPDDSHFWPTIHLQVPPDVHARYRSLVEDLDGEDEAERFAVLLDLAEQTLAATGA